MAAETTRLRSRRKLSPLDRAVLRQDVASIRRILRADPAAANQMIEDEDEEGGFVTALHVACASGWLAGCHLMVGAGAKVDSPSHWTPLMQACRDGHAECAQFFLSRGASTSTRDGDEFQPLMIAAYYGRVECVRVLLDHGANIHYRIRRLKVIDDSEVDMNALSAASRNGDASCVQLLLERKASVQQVRDPPPLMWAVEAPSVACARLLLEHRASVDVGTPAFAFQPLMSASQQGDLEMTLTLLDAHADPNRVSRMDGVTATALSLACFHGATECVRMLLDRGADPNLGSPFREDVWRDKMSVAFFSAFISSQMESLQLVQAYGAGRSPAVIAMPYTTPDDARSYLLAILHFRASTTFHDDVVNWLVETWDLVSPLCYPNLISLSHAEAALARGGSLYARVQAGLRTPLDIASHVVIAGNDSGALPVAQLLLKAAKSWSPQTHRLFPPFVRQRAVQLLMMGYKWASGTCFLGEHQAIFDIWVDHVMPKVLVRPKGAIPDLQCLLQYERLTPGSFEALIIYQDPVHPSERFD